MIGVRDEEQKGRLEKTGERDAHRDFFSIAFSCVGEDNVIRAVGWSVGVGKGEMDLTSL